MSALRNLINNAGTITITVPLNSTGTTERGGTGTATITISPSNPRAYKNLIDTLDLLVRERIGTVTYS